MIDRSLDNIFNTRNERRFEWSVWDTQLSPEVHHLSQRHHGHLL